MNTSEKKRHEYFQLRIKGNLAKYLKSESEGEKLPADLADFRRGIQRYLRTSALPAGENMPADLADFRRGILAYLRSSALSAREKYAR